MSDKVWPEVYGCYNRVMRDRLVVQHGWTNYTQEQTVHGMFTRRPIYKIIPFVMDKSCIHITHHPDDPRCVGCHNIPKEEHATAP